MPTLNPYLAIGEILKPQGVRGEVKLRPITNNISRFEALQYAYFEENGAFIKKGLRFVRSDEDSVYVKIEGCDDRNAAESLRGRLIYIDRRNAVKLNDDANFIVDLVGLKGIDDEGGEYGSLTEVMQPGGNDVYVFMLDKTETLVPALKSVVLKVDLEGGILLMSAARLKEVAVTNDI